MKVVADLYATQCHLPVILHYSVIFHKHLLYRGSVKIEHTLAQNGSRKLWELMHNEPYVHSLGALTGMQAMQMVKGGLKAIYCSGWQVAADANAAAQVGAVTTLPPMGFACKATHNASVRCLPHIHSFLSSVALLPCCLLHCSVLFLVQVAATFVSLLLTSAWLAGVP